MARGIAHIHFILARRVIGPFKEVHLRRLNFVLKFAITNGWLLEVAKTHQTGKAVNHIIISVWIAKQKLVLYLPDVENVQQL